MASSTKETEKPLQIAKRPKNQSSDEEDDEKTEDSVSLTIRYFGAVGELIPMRATPMRRAAFLTGLSFKDVFTTFAEHMPEKAAGKRRWSGLPEITLHDKDGNDVLTLGQSNVCLKVIDKCNVSFPYTIYVPFPLRDSYLFVTLNI